jgi:hypothetical protein
MQLMMIVSLAEAFWLPPPVESVLLLKNAIVFPFSCVMWLVDASGPLETFAIERFAQTGDDDFVPG